MPSHNKIWLNAFDNTLLACASKSEDVIRHIIRGHCLSAQQTQNGSHWTHLENNTNQVCHVEQPNFNFSS